MHNPVSSTNGTAEVMADRLAVVYDASGRIVHIHRVTTLRGGKSRSNAEISSAALEHAQRGRYGHLAAGADVLLLEAHELKQGHTHRVDVATRTLFAEPRKQ